MLCTLNDTAAKLGAIIFPLVTKTPIKGMLLPHLDQNATITAGPARSANGTCAKGTENPFGSSKNTPSTAL